MAFKGKTSVYQYLMDIKKRHSAGFLVLIDPDRSSPEAIVDKAVRYEETGVDAILVGTSLMMANGFDNFIEAVRNVVNIPVIIFPGEKSQVTDRADAILFLSLLSGRNPDLIIGEQI
ncbi:geranylgeranylglyceryl/heptaprenylglyceryl phosphate synthase, partial [Candidatus Latescibacterota bacterium]